MVGLIKVLHASVQVGRRVELVHSIAGTNGVESSTVAQETPSEGSTWLGHMVHSTVEGHMGTEGTQESIAQEQPRLLALKS